MMLFVLFDTPGIHPPGINELSKEAMQITKG